MASTPTPRDPERVPRSGPGLRLRLWLGCLAAPLVAGGLLGWAVATRGSGLADPSIVWVWLPAIGGLGVLIAVVAAAWLDRHVVVHLHGLIRGAAAERVTDLRGLPSASGWGELSELTQELQALLTRHHAARRGTADLEAVLLQLARVRESLERWTREERWEPLPGESGVLAGVAGLLNRGMTREQSIRDDNHEAARQVRAEIADALADARESAEQAERGFVEATALLTSVRELHRLGAELTASLERLPAAPPAPSRAEAIESLRAAAAEAIGELVTASSDSVQHLAEGMSRVNEISDHVQRLANRATLVALQVVSAGPAPEGQADQLRRLAQEVREVTDRTGALSAEIEREVAAATERMAVARVGVGARLERLPLPEAAPAPRAAPLPDEAVRQLERVREMIGDAARKGERLSAAGERASRAAQRLVRRLDDELRDLDGLIVRLAPVDAVAPAAPARPTGTTGAEAPEAEAPEAEAPEAEAPETEAPGAGTLRLLGREPRPEPRVRGGEETP
jgi:chromosome segregation ATPase